MITPAPQGMPRVQGLPKLNEIKDSFIYGFQWATREGVLAEEPLRGVRLTLTNASLYSDTIHRGAGQIIPTARRVVNAATLLASPALLEPSYHINGCVRSYDIHLKIVCFHSL